MRLLRALAHAHVGAVLFVSALVAGAILHVAALPLAKRVVILDVNRVLRSALAGHVVIDRIGFLGLTHVDGIDAHADDPEGERIAAVEGVSARVSTVTLLRSVLGSHGPLVVDVPSLAIARADVRLDAGKDGALRIARTFAPRAPSPENEPPGREARVMLPDIRVEHARVHAEPDVANDADVEGAGVSLSFSPEGLHVDLSRGRLTIRGLPEGTKAQGDAKAEIAKPPLGPLVFHGSWDGAVGDVRERADVKLEGNHLDATLDAGPAASAQIRALLPAWPLASPTSAHAEVHGTVPRVDLSAEASVAGGTVRVSGPVTLGAGIAAALHAEVDALDGRTLLAPMPFGAIGGAGDLSLSWMPSGALDARIAWTLAHARWGASAIPPATVMADVTRTPAGDAIVHAEVTLREPGAPILLTLDLTPRRGSPIVAFDADVTVPHLENVPRLGGVATGTLHLRAGGAIDLAKNDLDAHLTAVAADLQLAGTTLKHVRAEAHARGKANAPSVDVSVDGEEVEAGSAHVAAFHGVGSVTTGGGLALHDVEVDVAGEDGPPVRIQAALATVAGGTVRVDHVVATGLGEPLEASVRASTSSFALQATSAGIDLGRLGSFAPMPLGAGTLGVDIDATVDGQSAEGRAVLVLSHASIAGLKNASARIDATLHGRQVAGHLTASAEDIGTLDVRSSSLQVGREELLTANPWRQAWGAIDVKADVDLAKVSARLFAGPWRDRATRPLDAVRGQLNVAVRLERDSESDMTPEVDVTARTRGLALAGRKGEREWRVEGVDPELHAVVNGNTGATSLSAEMRDGTGPLVTLEATSGSIPYANLFSDGGVVDALRATPFEAHVEVPSRPLASLPSILGTADMRGALNAKIDWHGAVTSPTVDLAATVARGPSDPKRMALPLDLAFAVHYDGAHLDAAVFGSSRGAPVLDARARAEVRAEDVLASLSGFELPWSADARVTLVKVPLRSFTALDDRQVRGTMSGEIELTGLHDDARAKVALTFDELQVGDATCKSASVRATADGHTFDGSLDLGDGSGGHLQTHARFGTHWGRALFPALDVAQPAEASLSAKQFRAALLLPFVNGTLTQLDGLIDADARVAIDPSHESARPEGTIAIKGGTFELSSMGGEFHDVAAKVVLAPDGVARLENAVAYGSSGEILASATARFNGFALEAARATVQIPRLTPLPLVFDGVQLGMLDGHFDISVDEQKKTGIEVGVQVPSLHLALPSGSATRDVQALGGLDGVRIGLVRPGEEFVATPLDGANEGAGGAHVAAKLPVRIAVKLGKDVQVTRDTDLDVRLEGQPTITIASDVHVTGQIRLTRGSLDVKGKSFAIEQGTVSFVGDDATNPQVLLTAGWSAPDGTRIYADFVGPLKTGKVTLRAEPSRPQNEILALLLFGTTDETSDTGNGSAQVNNMAAQAGGAVATQPLNKALGGFNRTLDKLGLEGGFSTHIDTSQPNPRPEVELQIARDISLQVAWVLGVPPVTSPDSTLVTLNWNFLRKWSLETTVGDAGTSIVDVVWQHRY